MKREFELVVNVPIRSAYDELGTAVSTPLRVTYSPGKEGEVLNLTATVTVEGRSYQVPVVLPADEAYAPRFVHRTLPLTIEPSSVEERTVVRDENGTIVGSRVELYPVLR